MPQARSLHKRGCEVCDDLFQCGLSQFFGGLCGAHPAAFALLRFGPCGVHICDPYRIDECQNRERARAAYLHIAVDAEANVKGFACQTRFFPGFGCGRFGGRLVVHRPAFGQDPTFGAATCDQADLDFVVPGSVAQSSKLCPRLCFCDLPQLEGDLIAAALRGRGEGHDADES